MSKEEMKNQIMSLMTVRQLKALKDDCTDFYDWIDAVSSLAIAMEGKSDGHKHH